MKILLVEDERPMAEAIGELLRKEQWDIDFAFDGEQGGHKALHQNYDIMVLDIMLPFKNGIDITKEVRANKISTPIILVTAKSEVSDKVLGLGSGADDYITKPFAARELIARIKAVTRRVDTVVGNGNLEYRDIILDSNKLMVKKGDSEVILRKKEAELLELLLRNQNSTISKYKIIELLWREDEDVFENNVEVHMSYLRKKLTELGSEIKIRTIRNMGYTIV